MPHVVEHTAILKGRKFLLANKKWTSAYYCDFVKDTVTKHVADR